MPDKDDFTLEVDMPIPTKTRDLIIENNISPTLNLEVGKQSVFTIVEVEAPAPIE